MTPKARRTAAARKALRHSRLVSTAVVLALAASLGAPAPLAVADNLEDQQAALRGNLVVQGSSTKTRGQPSVVCATRISP